MSDKWINQESNQTEESQGFEKGVAKTLSTMISLQMIVTVFLQLSPHFGI